MNGEIGKNFMITQGGLLVMKGRMCVPNIDDLRKVIMEEAHCSAYAIHPIVLRCIEQSRKTVGSQI